MPKQSQSGFSEYTASHLFEGTRSLETGLLRIHHKKIMDGSVPGRNQNERAEKVTRGKTDRKSVVVRSDDLGHTCGLFYSRCCILH
ncbi:hypothetical protein DPMN_152800 [Dreissena polymorpha]|uniref:Uncharacterized protein n=1 Tax=Dreissena polymorpha TaxID=45954 RepID=A0A9D4FHG0_DREPO|nr:hypothetical protein DPMN_152800 [Dreissena polymorpha]